MNNTGTIYKLCCVDTNITEEYVGSTKNFRHRKWQHKSNCNNEKGSRYNLYVYQFIRANGGFNNWIMIQLEVVNYETKRDLEAHERRWIELVKPKLNKNIPTRTKQEWYEDNNEYNKQYYNDNKEILLEKAKEYRKNNKELINQYYQDNKKILSDKAKQWYNNNKEKLLEKRKEYYNNNKEKLLETHTCECGGKYDYKNKSRHFKTKKHKELLSIEQIEIE